MADSGWVVFRPIATPFAGSALHLHEVSVIRPLWFVVLLAFFTLTASPAAAQPCAPPDYADVSCLSTARSPTVGLRTFGYALQGDEGLRSIFISEIRPSANAAAWGYSASNPTVTANAMGAIDASMHLYLGINDVFTNADGTIASDAEANARLDTLATIVGPKVAWVHLGFDEPVWRAHLLWCKARGIIGDACFVAGPQQEVVEVVTPNLQRWAAALRARFPGVEIWEVEAHPMIRANLRLPNNFDVYAMDCYGPFDQCSRDSSGRAYSVTDLVQTLKQKVVDLNAAHSGYRTLGVIPETFVGWDRRNPKTQSSAPPSVALPPFNSTVTDDAQLSTLVQRYASLVVNEPLVTTVINFQYDTATEGTVTFIGSRSNPQTRALLDGYGRSVLGRPVQSNTTPPTIDFQVFTDDHVGGFGSLWTWSGFNASSCRSVTEPAVGTQPPFGALYTPPPTSTASFDYTIECTGPYGTTQKTVTVFPAATIQPVACAVRPELCY